MRPLKIANIATVKVHGRNELHLKFSTELDLLEAYARITRAELPDGDDARDAARYRKLRALHWSEAPLCVVRYPKTAVRLGHECPSGDQLDEAVDGLP